MPGLPGGSFRLTVERIGRLGDITVEADNNTYLNELLVFDKSNIEEWSTRF